jgi:hypothetical protein
MVVNRSDRRVPVKETTGAPGFANSPDGHRRASLPDHPAWLPRPRLAQPLSWRHDLPGVIDDRSK